MVNIYIGDLVVELKWVVVVLDWFEEFWFFVD